MAVHHFIHDAQTGENRIAQLLFAPADMTVLVKIIRVLPIRFVLSFVHKPADGGSFLRVRHSSFPYLVCYLHFLRSFKAARCTNVFTPNTLRCLAAISIHRNGHKANNWAIQHNFSYIAMPLAALQGHFGETSGRLRNASSRCMQPVARAFRENPRHFIAIKC